MAKLCSDWSPGRPDAPRDGEGDLTAGRRKISPALASGNGEEIDTPSRPRFHHGMPARYLSVSLLGLAVGLASLTRRAAMTRRHARRRVLGSADVRDHADEAVAGGRLVGVEHREVRRPGGARQVRCSEMTALYEHFQAAYDKLHALAERHFRHQPSASTLQATALVREVYLRFAGLDPDSLHDREHFMAVAAARRRGLARPVRTTAAVSATPACASSRRRSSAGGMKRGCRTGAAGQRP